MIACAGVRKAGWVNRPEELLDFQMEQTLKILSLDLREEAQLEI